MKKKFSLSGMPDFSPIDNSRRDYILSIIKEQFILFGFLPIQTSSIERYREQESNEVEKLTFRLLNSGNYVDKLDDEQKNMLKNNIDTIKSNILTNMVSNKMLRYDLTVPFSRYVTENQSNITFPFKRYEIGSVWRADRPQKGRLREFTQCDADIIGDNSLLLEVELLNLINSIFNQLTIKNFMIKINNRKILEGIFENYDSKDSSFSPSFEDFCVIIDKLDKIGVDKVSELLLKNKYSKKFTQKIKDLFLLQGSFQDQKKYVFKQFQCLTNKITQGFEELSFILERVSDNINFDISLARGLSYYTGSIFEVVSPNSSNSLAGGGRYDNLTELFDLKNVSGVGVSLGLDRLFLEMELLKLFPKKINQSIDAFFINFGNRESKIAQSYVLQLRNCGKSSELYPSSLKISKQMSYADKRGAKFVVMIGEEEIKTNTLTIKNMNTGKQTSTTISEFIKLLNK